MLPASRAATGLGLVALLAVPARAQQSGSPEQLGTPASAQQPGPLERPVAHADGPTAGPVDRLVAEALRANLALAGARLAERSAAAEVREARGAYLPSLSVESRYSRLEGIPNVGDLVNPAYAALNQLTGTSRFPTNIDITLPQAQDSRFHLVQPLFNEEIRAGVAAAQARHDAERLQLSAAARQVAADVEIAYLEFASARRVEGIYDATLRVVEENERVAERLVNAGRATPDALYRARAERGDVEQQLAEARERRLAAIRSLNRILQRPLDAPPDEIPDSAFDLPLGIGADAAVAHALAAREELGVVDASARTADAGRRAATAAWLPSIALDAEYGLQGRDLRLGRNSGYWMASVVVSWNLVNGGRDAARREALGLQADRARTRRRDLAQTIALDVRDAFEAAVTARAAIATADARLEAARRTFELVRRRYEEGVASPFEFVDARTAMTSAELNRVLTAYRYAIRRVVLERVAALRDLTF
jgi:outer membrane protein TolC